MVAKDGDGSWMWRARRTVDVCLEPWIRGGSMDGQLFIRLEAQGLIACFVHVEVNRRFRVVL